ncbi:hypothetical protein Bhyg_10033, partial [Pseudolycoriella hygida]
YSEQIAMFPVGGRTVVLKGRLSKLEKIVDEFDPKLVTVPEGDLATFVQIKNHFQTNRPIETSLFTPSTRSENVQQLYDAAAKTPVNAMEDMDRILGQQDRRSSDIFLCTPVLGQSRKRIKTNCNLDIETGRPAAIEELRKWTSSEAIGDITVTPDCVARVGYNSQNNSTLVDSTLNAGPSQDVTDDVTVVSRLNEIPNDMPLDHRLPSPEEQCQIIALKYPAELIRVDTSARRFERMCGARKSMLHVPLNIGEHNNLNDDVQTVKRRSRSRKPRNKRRNTIAGTDQKEIEEAVRGDEDNEPPPSPIDNDDDHVIVPRSAYVNVQEMSRGNGNLLNSTKYHRSNELHYTRPDFQRLSHDQIDSGAKPYTMSSTLPRHTNSGLVVTQEKLTDIQVSPFQRSNNIYWTLQARKQANKKTEIFNEKQGVRDDFTLAKPLKNELPKRIEDLYSIPSKIKKRQELRPTPVGFATFFSPVKPDRSVTLNENAIKISPIDPRNSSSFKTSTPSKDDDLTTTSKPSLADEIRNKLHIQEGGYHSNNSSPISSGRSTPRAVLEPQSGQASDANELARCSDRLGTPKTSLMDFKKLLLSKAGKSVATTKPSAVEQLKLAKEVSKPTISNLNSSINILNLSGSPKTFANRRMIRQGTFGSPNKTAIPVGKSPRANWKYNYRTDVMSTPIPEVNSEEDSSPNSSKERNTKQSQSPLPTVEKGVIDEPLNMSGNIFLQAEENNFMRGESQVGKTAAGITRAQLLQARSQFLMGGKPQSPVSSAQFHRGHYTGMSSSVKSSEPNVGQTNCTDSNSPVTSTLETAFVESRPVQKFPSSLAKCW